MRILILGGTAFMGPHVVTSLAELGHAVNVFHRGEREPVLPASVRHLHHPAAPLGERPYLGDFADEFRRMAPEIVLDMIPMTEAAASAAIAAFRGIARRIVALSSQDVYAGYDVLRGREERIVPTPFNEESPLREQLYPYRADPPRAADASDRWMDDYDKILVERAFLEEPDLPATLLRLPAVYGPNDRQHRLHTYLKWMDDGQPAILLLRKEAGWRWSRAYVENAAAAIVLAILDERAAGRVYNVAEPEALSEPEWVRKIGEIAGWQGELVLVEPERLPPDLPLPSHLQASYNFAQDLVADTTRIRQELGYREPVPLEEALRRTVEWERANPPEKLDPALFDYEAAGRVLEAMREG